MSYTERVREIEIARERERARAGLKKPPQAFYPSEPLGTGRQVRTAQASSGDSLRAWV